MRKEQVSPAGNDQTESKKTVPLSKEGIEGLKTAFVKEITISRQHKGLSQKNLQDVSGVKQPVIARLELGETDPQLTTILKVLYPLGMTLAVVPLYTKYNGSPE